MRKVFSYIEQKNIDIILRRVTGISSISDLLGKDKNGNVNHGSLLFYVLPHLFGRLLDNDPDRVLSKRSVNFRQRIISALRLTCPLFLNGKKLVIEKKAALPNDERPIIFISNHGFVEDAIGMSLMADGAAYYMFGSLPQAFNTSMGIAAYLNGFILVNRKDKASKIASIEKAVRALELGANLIFCPEGVWNKSANQLTLEFWPGIMKIAKRSNAQIVPIIQLLVDQEIYISRLTPFDIRPCLKNGSVHSSERFFRQTRRFDAGILCVFQGKSTQYGGKIFADWACCPFFKQGLINITMTN